MTDAKKNELAALRIHEKAFTQSIAAAELRGNAHFTVLGVEKANLKNIQEKIAEIENADVPPAPSTEI